MALALHFKPLDKSITLSWLTDGNHGNLEKKLSANGLSMVDQGATKRVMLGQAMLSKPRLTGGESNQLHYPLFVSRLRS